MALGMMWLALLGCTPEPGLTDDTGDEVVDPTADSDGDGYADVDELAAGTDPDDPEDRIYTGGWPYNPDKDSLEDPGFGGTLEVGDRVPRLVTLDQYGETVDLYDFAGHDKPVVLDLSALWCGPCTEVAAWLAHEESSLMAQFPEYDGVRDQVAAGEVLWVTVLFENASREPATVEDAELWHEEWPSSVPALLDDDRAMHDWVQPGSFPIVVLLDDELTVEVFDRFSFTTTMDALTAR